MIKVILTWLFVFSLLGVNAQENIIKDFAESRRDLKYTLYASTLRMLNIEQRKEINELVNDIDKVLFYKLDSLTLANKEYQELTQSYLKAGFEEYASAYGGGQYLSILGKSEKEYVGVFGQTDQSIFACYLKGEVPWQKLPGFYRALQSNQLLNFMTLNKKN